MLPRLLRDARDAGCEYVHRRWMRHDGGVVCVAREDELLSDVRVVDGGGGDDDDDDDEGDDADGGAGGGIAAGSATAGDDDGDGGCRIRGGLLGGLLDAVSKVSFAFGGIVGRRDEKPLLLLRGGIDVDTELNSMGIRRWRYQKVLHDACVKVGIFVHFGKRVIKVTSIGGGGGGGGGEPTTLPLPPRTLLEFKDGTKVTSSLLIGADGINSEIRRYVANPNPIPPSAEDEDEGGGGGSDRRYSWGGGRRRTEGGVRRGVHGRDVSHGMRVGAVPTGHIFPEQRHDEVPRLLLPHSRRGTAGGGDFRGEEGGGQ